MTIMVGSSIKLVPTLTRSGRLVRQTRVPGHRRRSTLASPLETQVPRLVPGHRRRSTLASPLEAQAPRLVPGCRRRSTLASPLEEHERGEEMGREDARPFSDIPGPKGWPFFGSSHLYTRGPYSIDKFHHGLLDMYYKYGKIYKQTILGQTSVHLFDPEFSKVVYQAEGRVPHVPPLQEGTQLYRKYRNMSLGLGNTNGEEWYRLRSAVQQMMMRPHAVSQYLPLVQQVADDFVTRIDELRDPQGEVPNFRNELLKWNLESSGMTCFETRLGCLEAGPGDLPQKMVDANAAIFEHTTQMKFTVPWHRLFSTRLWTKLVESEDLFFGNGQRLVDKTVDHIRSLMSRGELEEGQYKFMTYLMARPNMSYKDLSIISLSLFADGLSTTVPSLIGQLFCLATNQEQQDKLYEEIKSHKEEDLTAAGINKLSYLKAVVKEGFRFFPVGPDVARIPQKDLVLGGYHIPAGTHLYLHNNMLLRLSEYFEDPDTYRPERWLRTGEESNIHPYLLLPFSFGPRMCAGRRFAEQEMYVLLTKILRKFRVEWPHPDKMAQRYVLLLTPDKPARFKFTPRE